MNFLDIDVGEHRKPDHPVHPLLLNRWSARAMSGEPVATAQLMTLFDAARWAPSCFNDQPWRFLYAHRDGPHWSVFLDLLSSSNRLWCEKAGALVLLLSNRLRSGNGAPSISHSLDAGAAWQNFALQASSMGLVVHGLLGFDRGRAREALKIPQQMKVEMMAVVGKPGDLQSLPEELRLREKPSGRKPLAELVHEGGF